MPGRDIMAQAWYQGGISLIDFTDSANPVEIAFFDRGPISATSLVLGGFWSAYWYNGNIYGSEIARGFDVFGLLPSEHLTEAEIAAAREVQLDEFNAQHQRRSRGRRASPSPGPGSTSWPARARRPSRAGTTGRSWSRASGGAHGSSGLSSTRPSTARWTRRQRRRPGPSSPATRSTDRDLEPDHPGPIDLGAPNNVRTGITAGASLDWADPTVPSDLARLSRVQCW